MTLGGVDDGLFSPSETSSLECLESRARFIIEGLDEGLHTQCWRKRSVRHLAWLGNDRRASPSLRASKTESAETSRESTLRRARVKNVLSKRVSESTSARTVDGYLGLRVFWPTPFRLLLPRLG